MYFGTINLHKPGVTIQRMVAGILNLLSFRPAGEILNVTRHKPRFKIPRFTRMTAAGHLDDRRDLIFHNLTRFLPLVGMTNHAEKLQAWFLKLKKFYR